MSREPRHVFRLHPVEPRIGEPDRIYHSLIELGDARRRIALPGLDGDRLGRKTTELLERDHLRDLLAIARGPRCEDDRILKREPGDVDGETRGRLHLPEPLPTRRSERRRYSCAASAIARAIMV